MPLCNRQPPSVARAHAQGAHEASSWARVTSTPVNPQRTDLSPVASPELGCGGRDATSHGKASTRIKPGRPSPSRYPSGMSCSGDNHWWVPAAYARGDAGHDQLR